MTWLLSRAWEIAGAPEAGWDRAVLEPSPLRVARCDCGSCRLSPTLDDFRCQQPFLRPVPQEEGEAEAAGSAVAVVAVVASVVPAVAAEVVAAAKPEAAAKLEAAASWRRMPEQDSPGLVPWAEPTPRRAACPSRRTKLQPSRWMRRLLRLIAVRSAHVGAGAERPRDRVIVAPATPGNTVFPQRYNESHDRIPERPARGSRRRLHSRAAQRVGMRARSDACMEYSSAIRRTFMRLRSSHRRRNGSFPHASPRRVRRRRAGAARPLSVQGSTRRSRSWR